MADIFAQKVTRQPLPSPFPNLLLECMQTANGERALNGTPNADFGFNLRDLTLNDILKQCLNCINERSCVFMFRIYMFRISNKRSPKNAEHNL